MLSVRVTKSYCAEMFPEPAMQCLVSVGCRANASVLPSGLIAGRLPVVISVGLPPDTATDSTSSTHPCRLLK